MDNTTETNETQASARTKTEAANVFAVDRETWNRACELGLNPAVAYLVLARGTGGDNRTTSWSAHAVETHAGISRDKAPLAVKALIDAGLVTKTKIVGKPRYRIEPSYRVRGCRSFQEDADEAFAKDFKPAWIWLSNDLVQAPKDLGEPPIKLLRRRRDLAGLRLLVNLYGDLTFAAEGGLDWSDTGIRQVYARDRLGKFGDHVVYAFKPGRLAWNPDGPLATRYGAEFEPAFKRLLEAEIVCMAPHLVDDIGDAAEVVHTLADVEQAAHPDETGPRHAADRLARRLVPADKIAEAEARGYSLCVPAPDHWNPPEVVGIARLAFLANARMAAEWLSRNIDKWHDHARDYQRTFSALESATSRF